MDLLPIKSMPVAVVWFGEIIEWDRFLKMQRQMHKAMRQRKKLRNICLYEQKQVDEAKKTHPDFVKEMEYGIVQVPDGSIINKSNGKS